MATYQEVRTVYTCYGKTTLTPVTLTEAEYTAECKRLTDQGFIQEPDSLVYWNSDIYGNMMIEFMEV